MKAITRIASRAAMAAAASLVSPLLHANSSPPTITVSDAGAVVSVWKDAIWGATYYVAPPPTGNDSNPGTSAEPFATIQQAINTGQSQIATVNVRILVSPGTYDEYLSLNYGTHGEASPNCVSIEVNGSGAVQVTGTQPYQSGWTEIATGIYSHAWSYAWGYQDVPWSTEDPELENTVLARREAVFSNGLMLKQMRLPDAALGITGDISSPSDLATGEFAVDDTNGLIYMRDSSNPFTGGVPEYAVDITDQPNADGPWDSVISSTDNVRLVGLTFMRYPTVWQEGGLKVDSVNNFLFSDGVCSQGAAAGMQITNSSEITLCSSKFTSDGSLGLSCSSDSQLEITNCLFQYDNKRGAWMDFATWYIAGAKLGSCEDVAIENATTFEDNSCTGLWFDVGSDDTLVTDCTMTNNKLTGVSTCMGYWCEISGAATGCELTGCTLTGNQYGAYISNSDNCYVHDNSSILNNTLGQVVLRNYSRPGDPPYCDNLWFERNTAGVNTGSPIDIICAVDSDATLYGECLAAAHFDTNTYDSNGNVGAHLFEDTPGTFVKFTNWVIDTGLDATGSTIE